jgi:hypothetical protein
MFPTFSTRPNIKGVDLPQVFLSRHFSQLITASSNALSPCSLERHYVFLRDATSALQHLCRTCSCASGSITYINASNASLADRSRFHTTSDVFLEHLLCEQLEYLVCPIPLVHSWHVFISQAQHAPRPTAAHEYFDDHQVAHWALSVVTMPTIPHSTVAAAFTC